MRINLYWFKIFRSPETYLKNEWNRFLDDDFYENESIIDIYLLVEN